MKDTRTTRISASFFNNQNYITNPSVTPEDRVMATSGKLAADLKDRMATQLSKTYLQQLEKLGTILKQVWTHKENQRRTPQISPSKQTKKVPVALTQKFRAVLPLLGLVPTTKLPPNPTSIYNETPPMVAPLIRV